MGDRINFSGGYIELNQAGWQSIVNGGIVQGLVRAGASNYEDKCAHEHGGSYTLSQNVRIGRYNRMGRTVYIDRDTYTDKWLENNGRGSYGL